MLWERAYDKTKNYLGLDKRQFDDERRTIVCDSARFLRHQDVRLAQWDLFDLDAFGSPLEHLAILGHRLRVEPGRRVGICLTDGTGFNSKMNGTPHGLLRYVGLNPHKGTRVQADYREEVFGLAVTKAIRTARLTVIQGKESKKTGGSEMRYTALLCEGF